MRLLLIILISTTLYSCASKEIIIETLESAQAHEVTQLRRLAVAPFTNDSRGIVTAAVEKALASVQLSGRAYFNIIDMKGTGYLPPYPGESLAFDVPAVSEYGRKAGADGVLLATVMRNDVRNIRTHEQRSICTVEDESGNCRKVAIRKVPCLRREGTFCFTPKVVNPRTGQIIFSSEFCEAEESSVCYGETDIPPSGIELLEVARERAISRFLNQVTPHRVRTPVPLLTEDDSSMSESVKVAIENGVEFARANRMDRACAIWSDAARSHSQGYALPYLLGVCDEVAGRLEQAQAQYELADQRANRPVREIGSAKERVRKALLGKNILNLQTN